MAGYTVMDFETTGFSPAHGDRVVEVAMVKVSHEGEVYDAWSTLVNPQRDVGAASIHGITARDVVGAPTFADIAPLVLDAVDGRILAAHNAAFDLRFLASELQRAGYPLSVGPLQGVCTMHWADAFLRSPSRRLADCCGAADIDLRGGAQRSWGCPGHGPTARHLSGEAVVPADVAGHAGLEPGLSMAGTS